MHGLLLFLFLGILSAANAATFKDCGSIAKDPSIDIEGCANTDAVCVLRSGQNASMTATFTTPSLVQKATVKISASVGVVKVNLPLKPAEACDHWGLKCPAETGSRQTLKVELPIESSYPKMNIGVELELIDQTGNKLICKSFPVEIK